MSTPAISQARHCNYLSGVGGGGITKKMMEEDGGKGGVHQKMMDYYDNGGWLD